jgi:GntR family transcriptional regulator/MocR family aminotransferase
MLVPFGRGLEAMSRTVGALPLLIRLDPRAPQPLNQQLYQGLRTIILEGGLAAGTRLPSTRAFAVDLAVSRNTVLDAFERLTGEGYLQGKAGGGTRVSTTLPDDLLGVRAQAVRARKPTQRRPSRRGAMAAAIPVRVRRSLSPEGPRAFRLGAGALVDFPVEVWGRLARRRWSRSGLRSLDYGDIAGYPPLREAIAAYLQRSRGVICDPSQVLVVHGSQQALDLATRVVLDPGDFVWMEDPGYDAARGAFIAGGARIVSIPVDGEGLNVTKGMQRARHARLAYVTPSHQFPLGVTMSLARRLELLRWAATSNAWVLEDDYDSEFRYANRPLAALQGLDAEASVIYTGTFSKVLFPALRLGYVVVPPALVHAFVKVRLLTDVHSPAFMQAVLADFITEGHFERHIRRMRVLYRARQEALLAASRDELAGRLDVQPADGGMHLVGWLPEGVDDQDASRRAAAEGLEAVALSFFSSSRPRRGGLLLGYAGLTPDEIVEGVRRLARALDRTGRRAGRARNASSASRVASALRTSSRHR